MIRIARATFIGLLTTLGLWTGVVAPVTPTLASPLLFDSREVRLSSVDAHPKWAQVMRRAAMTAIATADCGTDGASPCREVDWRARIEAFRSLELHARLDAVNRFFNAAPYVSDRRNYGVGDYWATPDELLQRGGDCEDFAIAKYLALRALGGDPEEMRILVLRDLERRVEHAVLIVYEGSKTWVLDDRLPAVTDSALIHVYRPIYSIDEVGWWFHINPDDSPTMISLDSGRVR
jgi:predicted transglutaminase-like cysteine proteinase